jgi:hypothetical protein
VVRARLRCFGRSAASAWIRSFHVLWSHFTVSLPLSRTTTFNALFTCFFDCSCDQQTCLRLHTVTAAHLSLCRHAEQHDSFNIILSQFSQGTRTTSHRGRYKQARLPTHLRKLTMERTTLARVSNHTLCLLATSSEGSLSGLPACFDQQKAHARRTHTQLAALCIKDEASRFPFGTTATANPSSCGEV